MTEELYLESIEELLHIKNFEAVVSIKINTPYPPSNIYKDYFSKCINLRAVYIERGTYLTDIPSAIFDCSRLETLSISHSHIYRLNDKIGQLTNLKRLTLSYISLTSIPYAFSFLSKLEVLDFMNTKFRCVLDFWEDLKQLKHLNLYKTNLKKFPLEILELPHLEELFLPKALFDVVQKTHPEFEQRLLYLFQHSDLEKKYTFNLIRVCNKNNYNPRFRAVLLNLLADNGAKLEKLATLPMVLEATDVKTIEIVRLKALKYYEKRWGKAYQHTFKKDCNIAVVGNLGKNKNELQRQLKEQKIKYSAKITDKTTHLLLGQLSHKVYNEALSKNIPIVTEQMVLEFINNNSEQFLVDDTEARPETSQNISNLLLSGQDENIIIALELFKHGGFPKELLTELFVACKQTQDPKIAHELERLIRQYGSIDLIDLAKKNGQLFSKYTSEGRLVTILNYFEKNTQLDVLKIAKHGYNQYKKGITFLLNRVSSKEKKQLLQELIINSTLNLSRLNLTSIPSEVFEFTELTTLDLSVNKLKSIPIKSLKNLINLKLLKLNWNTQLWHKRESLSEQIKSILPQLVVEF